MQTHAEAIAPTVAAVKAALAGTTAVTTLLSGGSAAIHEGEAPVATSGDPLPSYIVLSTPAGEDESVFMAVGCATRCSIDLWCDTQAKVLALYVQVAKVIDGPTLSLSGMNHLSGLTRLLTTIRDPGRRHLYHGVVQYEAVVR